MEDTFVSAKMYGKTVTISGFPADSTLLDLLEIFQAISIGLTYSPTSWEDCIIELAETYKENQGMPHGHS
jgi:hypothetical protein